MEQPLEEFPKTYNPAETEEKIYRMWEEGGYFKPFDSAQGKPRKNHNGKKFVAWMAPPNITGSLHMGHALENSLLDLIVRKRRMEGFETLWVPGTDHAGIATQNVVEKELRKENISRHDLGREKFVEKVWQWREKYGNIILEQFRKLGISPDWSRLVFTLDESYVKAVQTAFLKYFHEEWIYRAQKVVNWCPRCGTTISDLEVVHKEEHGKLWYIKYPLKDGGSITVATTRPETMLGDTAVAVNPKDERYQKLIGQSVILPIMNREIPIVADAIVDPKFGTGAVKVTPAHDIIDYEISLRHKLSMLPMIQVINEFGRMTEEAGAEFKDLKAKEAREKVVVKLEELKLIEKVEDYKMSVATCERCGTVVEPIPSWQWFLKMQELAKLAIEVVEKEETKFEPERWKKSMLEWLKNVRDWPISRQLWWGHRLPIWFCQNKKDGTGQPAYVVSAEKLASCLHCKKCEPEQSPDVLDTWFSSALWPFATLGWPEKTEDLEKYFPGDIISSAPEILYLWISRMIFSGKYFLKKAPFKLEYVHATVLTKDGKRMSKSLGTGIDPLNLIEKYGADATRFGLIWQSTGSQAIHFDEGVVMNGKKFANKLWNTARFVIMKIGDGSFDAEKAVLPKKITREEDKKLVSDFQAAAKEYNDCIETFRFGQGLEVLYHFIWHVFCDQYLESTKSREDEEAKQILLWSLVSFLKLLHPVMPFLTEAIWQRLPVAEKKEPMIIQNWPSDEIAKIK